MKFIIRAEEGEGKGARLADRRDQKQEDAQGPQRKVLDFTWDQTQAKVGVIGRIRCA